MLYIKATLVTVDAKRRILEDAGLVVRQNVIVDIAKTQELLSRYPDEEVRDLEGLVVIPGLVSTHMHLVQSVLRGTADNHSLRDWLCDRIWPLEAAFEEDDGYHAARHSIAEMLKSGTTTFLESLLMHQANFPLIVRAVEEMGIRACLGKLTKPNALDRNGGPALHDPRDAEAPNMSIEATLAAHEEYHGRANDRIHVWFAAVTPRAGDVKAHHTALASAAKSKGIRITMHCAEAKKDQAFYRDAFDQTPMEYCCETGLAGSNTVLAHMVHLNKRDIDLLVSTGTHVAHNPASNCKLASGIAPIPDLLASNINVGLGCDGAPCNNTVDLLQEMRLASLIHRASRQDASIMQAENVLEMATINGAKALGLEESIGSLEVGKKADFVVLNLKTIASAPTHHIVSSIVYTATSQNVEMTVVDGQELVINGRLKGEDTIVKMAEERSRALLARAKIVVPQSWPVE